MTSRGGYTVQPDTKSSTGGVAVDLELVVKSWEGGIWFFVSRTCAVVEDRLAETTGEADNTPESVVEESFGYIYYCQLEEGLGQ